MKIDGLHDALDCVEAPAIEQHPEILEIKEQLCSNGAIASLMSGSGSAVFGVYEEESAAQEAMKKLSHLGKCFVCTTISREKVFSSGNIARDDRLNRHVIDHLQ